MGIATLDLMSRGETMRGQRHHALWHHRTMRVLLGIHATAMACALLGYSTPGVACDIPPPPALTIVANPLDVTPPATPTARLVKVHLGETGACVGHGDCRDLTRVEIELMSVDDVSAPNAIGYVFEPRDAPLYLAGKPVIAAEDRLSVYINGSDEAHGPDFDVRVFAVDQAGNVSDEGALLTVRRSEAGCSVGPNAQRGAMWTLATLGFLAWTQKRRRRC